MCVCVFLCPAGVVSARQLVVLVPFRELNWTDQWAQQWQESSSEEGLWTSVHRTEALTIGIVTERGSVAGWCRNAWVENGYHPSTRERLHDGRGTVQR